LTNFRYLVQKEILSPAQALMPFTSTPAAFYKLPGKGEIKLGNDADLLLLDSEWNLTDVFSRGCRMMSDGKLMVRGTFSDQAE
jgi:beta-aspartyl-dipeptidase (metallo-type)